MTDKSGGIIAWSMHTSDDGATWSGAQLPHANPVEATTTFWLTPGGGDGAIRAVRVAEHNTLIAMVADYGPQGGDPTEVHDTFIVCDGGTRNTANADSQGIVFKRGENRGTAAWL